MDSRTTAEIFGFEALRSRRSALLADSATKLDGPDGELWFYVGRLHNGYVTHWLCSHRHYFREDAVDCARQALDTLNQE